MCFLNFASSLSAQPAGRPGSESGRPSDREFRFESKPPAPGESEWPTFEGFPPGPSGHGVQYTDSPAVSEQDLRRGLSSFYEAESRNPASRGFAARAPYPYYHDYASMNSADGAVGTPGWNKLESQYWLNNGGRHGWRGRFRQAQGFGGPGFDYTQVSGDAHSPSVQWLKISLGPQLPLTGGYFRLLPGIGWLDDNRDFDRSLTFDIQPEVMLYPIWPLGIEAGLDYALVEGGRRVVDFYVQAEVQLWRAAFFEAGYRRITRPGHENSLRTEGLYLGISISFSNLRTIFFRPDGGPADGIFGLLGW